jgi:hypothetical protein
LAERLRNSNKYATIDSLAVDFPADELCRENHKNIVERIEGLILALPPSHHNHNRFRHQDGDVKSRIVPTPEKRRLSDEDSQKMLGIILQSDGVKDLKNYMDKLKETVLSTQH